MRGRIPKHTVKVHGHITSMSIEKEFWEIFCQIREKYGISAQTLVTMIDNQRTYKNLSRSVRVFLLAYVQGTVQIGHGPAQEVRVESSVRM